VKDCWKCKNFVIGDVSSIQDRCRVGDHPRRERESGFIMALLLNKCGKAGRKFVAGQPTDSYTGPRDLASH
jgi:hypothetical protein